MHPARRVAAVGHARLRTHRHRNCEDLPAASYGSEGREHAGESVGVLPEPAVGVFTTVGTCQGRLRRDSVILRDRLRRPLTEPACRKVPQQPGSEEGSGQAAARSVPQCRPGSGDDDRGAARPGVGHDRMRRGACRGRVASQSLGESGHSAAPRDGSHGRARRGAGTADHSPFCKPICKPDAARQLETGETEPTERDEICPVRRGHRARERRPETPETEVVWLITQRSRVQIPPPLLVSAGQGPFPAGEGLGVSGHVTTTGAGALPEAETSPDGARQCGTWLNTLLEISGCLAQRHHRHH